MRGFFDAITISNSMYPIGLVVYGLKKRSIKEAFRMTHRAHRKFIFFGLLSSYSYQYYLS
jgi:hypothetical protein